MNIKVEPMLQTYASQPPPQSDNPHRHLHQLNLLQHHYNNANNSQTVANSNGLATNNNNNNNSNANHNVNGSNQFSFHVQHNNPVNHNNSSILLNKQNKLLNGNAASSLNEQHYHVSSDFPSSTNKILVHQQQHQQPPLLLPSQHVVQHNHSNSSSSSSTAEHNNQNRYLAYFRGNNNNNTINDEYDDDDDDFYLNENNNNVNNGNSNSDYNDHENHHHHSHHHQPLSTIHHHQHHQQQQQMLNDDLEENENENMDDQDLDDSFNFNGGQQMLVSAAGGNSMGANGGAGSNGFLIRSSLHSNENCKIRKRSANQAYEYLTSLPDSKSFQEWLSMNETDFTWVHKRNSMTNAGKKYYYICNFRIKKGYVRCPAVIYALFPTNFGTDTNIKMSVIVFSCGDHDHRRVQGAISDVSLPLSPTTTTNSNNNNNRCSNPSIMPLNGATSILNNKALDQWTSENSNNTTTSSQSPIKSLEKIVNKTTTNLKPPAFNNAVNGNSNMQEKMLTNRTNRTQFKSVGSSSSSSSSSSPTMQNGLVINASNQINSSTTIHTTKVIINNNNNNNNSMDNASLNSVNLNNDDEDYLCEVDPVDENDFVSVNSKKKAKGDGDVGKKTSQQDLDVIIQNEESDDLNEKNDADGKKADQEINLNGRSPPISNIKNTNTNNSDESKASALSPNIQANGTFHRPISSINPKNVSAINTSTSTNSISSSSSSPQLLSALTNSFNPNRTKQLLNTFNFSNKLMNGNSQILNSLSQSINPKKRPITSTFDSNAGINVHNHLIQQQNLSSNNNQTVFSNSNSFLYTDGDSSPISRCSTNVNSNNPIYNQIINNTNQSIAFNNSNQLSNGIFRHSTKGYKAKNHRRRELETMHSLSQAFNANKMQQQQQVSPKNPVNATARNQQPNNSPSTTNGNGNGNGNLHLLNQETSNTKSSSISLNSQIELVVSPSSSVSSTSVSSPTSISEPPLLINHSSSLLVASAANININSNKGLPRAAVLCMENAPVRVDVGGCVYTTSLETLTKFADSRLSKMFNGSLPVVMDAAKQQYFIDRDGKSFRYILNFMRTNRLVLPERYDDHLSLLEEAKYYELEPVVKELEKVIGARKRFKPNESSSLPQSPINDKNTDKNSMDSTSDMEDASKANTYENGSS